MRPDYQGRGVGGKLIEARFELVRALNLRGMVAGSLITDYHRVAREVSPEQYVQDVVAGKRFDSNLSKQLRKGFQVRGLIPNYTIADSSCHYGVEIVWDNPDYRPAHRLPLHVVPRRPAALRYQRAVPPAYRSA
ncbi:MAG: hypothetical protein HZC41_09850 [Chloroflexi bacterium]|nr:hypothetical protein [Chloroflexota bacterium]